MNTFEDRVKRTIEQLQQDDFRAMAASITSNRMAWLARLPQKKACAEYGPREAFDLLFFEQMQLRRDELPVISETEDEIVWLSYNRCTLLEACNRLGLDTRQVCRPVNEKATQAFLSWLNPQLRFHRSYEEIRPHADYCKERIIRIDFEAYMRAAIQEARVAQAEGNRACGAVVVFEDRVIGQAHDTAFTERDPGAHAAMGAIRQAVQTLGDANLCGAVLFVTGEPCPMCASLAAWADVTTIVYGVCSAELGGARIRVSAQHIVEQSPRAIEVISGVLYDECRELYK